MGEPPVEEGLDVRWAQAVTDLLERRGVGAGEEPVVQGDDADPLVPELPLRPLVPVEAALHGVRGVAAHLQEGGPPRGIEHVDVVMIHADGLPAVGEVDVAPPPLFRGGPGLGLLLRHTDADHAVGAPEPRAVPLHHRVLPLALVELDPGDALAGRPGAEAPLERLRDLPEGRRRGDVLTIDVTLSLNHASPHP